MARSGARISRKPQRSRQRRTAFGWRACTTAPVARRRRFARSRMARACETSAGRCPARDATHSRLSRTAKRSAALQRLARTAQSRRPRNNSRISQQTRPVMPLEQWQEEAFDDVDEEERKHKGNGHAKALRFQIKPWEAIKLSTEPNYRVMGILPRVGLVVVWGPPKCGKSFWTFALVVHVALGWKYRGRKVQQGAVVYLALEGGPGFAARKEAWQQRHLADHGAPVPSFNLIDMPVDLIADHNALIEDIEAQVSETPAIVVIDTLNRSLNGSESKDQDMGKYIRAADTIRARFGCLVIIIHHCGVAGQRPRGHTSLTGADDAQISVYREKDGDITVTVEHMKDGEASAPMASKLEPVTVGINDEGDPITSCVIVETDVVDKKKAKKEQAKKDRSLPGDAEMALRELQSLI